MALPLKHSYIANIITIPKGSKASLTSSDKYRSIANSSVIGKILDHVIIDRLSDCLETSDYQFGFKSKSSTVLCSTMVNETIQYYIEKCGKQNLQSRNLILRKMHFYKKRKN